MRSGGSLPRRPDDGAPGEPRILLPRGPGHADPGACGSVAAQALKIAGGADSLLSDSVVVVVPPGVFGPYAGTAGDGQLLVFGTDGIRADVTNNPELGRFVLSVTPVVERAGTIMADKRKSL